MELNVRQIFFFRYRILQHIAFWFFIVGFFSSYALILGYPANVVFYHIVFLPFEMVPVYLTIYGLIPRFLLTNKIFLFLISLHIIIFVILIISYYVKSLILPPDLFTPGSVKHFFAYVYNTIMVLYLEIGLASMIKLFKHWYVISVRKAELENSNFQSELILLRSQINPHFLFNTLNNIYSLVLKKDPMAPEAVMKLSEMLRYTLNDTGTDLVDLKNELHYINSYIALQKLRIEDPSFVDFKIEGNPNHRTIVPMLLIPVIENAFKHGLKKASSPRIIIRLHIEPCDIQLSVKNSINKAIPSEAASGIGLQNLRRRLVLLYPDRHELNIQHDDKVYFIQLKLKTV